MQLADHLERLDYFSVLEAPQLEKLTSRALLRYFETDEIIFLQGDPSTGLWIIDSGSVKISKLSAGGDEFILHLLGSGDTFNDISAFDGGPNPANATALSTAACWIIPSAVLRSCLLDCPAMGLEVIESFARRIRGATEQLESLALYSVTIRLARFLLEQAENPSLTEPGITRAAIASHLATTPETISRLLVKLQESGAIRFDRHRILITDSNILRSIAEL